MFWGVRLEDLKSEDPPVQQGNDQEDVWYLDAEHLSSFLISTVCWQAALGLPFSGVGEVDDQLLSDLEKQLTNASAGIVDREVDLIGFFEKGLVVAVSKSANKMMVGTNKEKGLESFEERFDTGLDWL